jgi:hypothetical protein
LQANRPRLLRGIVPKALALFILVNVVYYFTQPLNLLNRVSVYNVLVPGRLRLPFGEYPDQSHSIVTGNLDMMLASHQVARPKAPDEYRVIMLGDSSVWGYLLDPAQSQAACLDRLGLQLPSGKRVHFYNLGYPTLSVMKDLLILRHSLTDKPDLIVWSTTLASLYPSDQLGFEIVSAQVDEIAALEAQYKFTLYQWPLPTPSFWDKTLFGQRRDIAEWLRYQLYGLDWAATGIDQIVPKFVTPRPTNLPGNDQMLLVEPMKMHLSADHKVLDKDLSFDIVKAGIDTAGAQNIPVLLINEPMYRSATDKVRWNYYYPRWAYDSYRDAFQQVAAREGWHYLDLWDTAPDDQFTDTDFHLTPAANCDYARSLSDPLLKLATGQ